MTKILTILCLLFSSTLDQWTEPSIISETDIRCDASNMVAQGENIFVVYYNPGPSSSSPRFVKSSDNGQNWSEPYILSDTTVLGGYFPRLLIIGDTLHVVFNGFVGSFDNRVFYRKSTNWGRTWNTPRPISESCNFLHDASIASVGGRLLCLFNANLVYPESASVMRLSSTNGGRNWDTANLILNNMNATYKMTLLQSRGRLHLIFGYYGTEAYEIAYIRSDDNGITWSPPAYLSPVDNYASQWPRAAIDSTGLLAVSWFDYKYGGGGGGFFGDILMNISADNGDTWGGERRITYLQDALTSGVIVDSPNVYIAYEDIRESPENWGGEIYFRWSSDSGENWSDEERLTNDNGLLSYDPELAISVVNDQKVIHLTYSEQLADTSLNVAILYTQKTVSTDVVEREYQILPNKIQLSAYPNPFNSATTITITGTEQAEIGIYDITGRLITTLHAIGGQTLWDAGGYSSGLYFARVAGEKAGTIKLILLK
jgi:hypothetical protein